MIDATSVSAPFSYCVSAPPNRGDTRDGRSLSGATPPAPPTMDIQIMGPPHCSRLGQCRPDVSGGEGSEERDLNGPLKPEVMMLM